MEKFPTTPKKQNDEPRPVKDSSSPDGKQKKQRIERDKARVSPSRPLPDVVQQLAESSEDSDSDSDDELVEMTQVLDLSRDLEEFDDDVPEGLKQRYGGRKPRRRPKKKKKDKEVEDSQPKSEPIGTYSQSVILRN
jgi:Fe-S-cluster formation regulator IscX/YfhJ